IQVREDLGYPVMITPYSQFVVTQSALNIATGERYKVVIDELIQYAAGVFSEDSGYTWMDENLTDKFLSLPRAKELIYDFAEDVPVKKVKEQFGGAFLSDEEFLMRYIMKDTQSIEDMRKAGPYKKYFPAGGSLYQLLDRLEKYPNIAHVQIQGFNRSLTLTNK